MRSQKVLLRINVETAVRQGALDNNGLVVWAWRVADQVQHLRPGVRNMVWPQYQHDTGLEAAGVVLADHDADIARREFDQRAYRKHAHALGELLNQYRVEVAFAPLVEQLQGFMRAFGIGVGSVAGDGG